MGLQVFGIDSQRGLKLFNRVGVIVLEEEGSSPGLVQTTRSRGYWSSTTRSLLAASS